MWQAGVGLLVLLVQLARWSLGVVAVVAAVQAVKAAVGRRRQLQAGAVATARRWRGPSEAGR